jgi:hypothetical protein
MRLHSPLLLVCATVSLVSGTPLAFIDDSDESGRRQYAQLPNTRLCTLALQTEELTKETTNLIPQVSPSVYPSYRGVRT